MISSIFAGKIGIQANRWDGISIQDGVEDDAGSISAERQSAGGHLIQHYTERKEVSARVELRAANLFWRHVGDCADGAAGTGEKFFRRCGGQSRNAEAFSERGELRQTEIENLGVAALGDEYVCGLDVAVDDAFRVGGFERVGNFDSPVEHLLERLWLATDVMFQRVSLRETPWR